MWLKSLKAENFRQLYGEQVLKFSNDSERGITIVHGENGSGKTTLLNAFKWAFYGKTTFDTKQDNLLNERAISEANDDDIIPMDIEISFEHGGNNYTLKRSQKYKKLTGLQTDTLGKSLLELSYIGNDGKFITEKAPQNAINQILPEKLHSYFFFNGERIEKLASMSASSQISDAIKTIMGLEIIERAINHLNGPVKSSLRKQSKKSGGNELDEVTRLQEDNSKQLNEFRTELSAKISSYEQFGIDIEEISDRLRRNEASAKLQEEADQNQSEIDDLRDGIYRNRREISETISKSGFLAFFDKTAKSVFSSLEDRRQKGELPYKIKPQFIDDLVEIGKCICDTKLEEGSPEYKAIQKYKTNTVPGLEEAFNTTTSDLKQVPSERAHMFKALERLSKNISESEKQIDRLNGRISEIDLELKNASKFNETITGLTQRKIDLNKSKDECRERQGVLKHEIQKLEVEEKELTDRFEKLSEANAKSKLISEKIKIAEEAKRVFEELYEVLSHDTRKELSLRVDETFKKIIRKPYWAEIDKDYKLQIYKKIPNEGKQPILEKSTGEKQITSLSFISSIISLAKEKETDDNKFFRGGTYPIIMDSPFGALDDEHRKLVASGIPQLAGQIILFATSSQWKGEVEEACKHFVGKQISLIYYGDLEGKPETKYKKASQGYEYTEIEEGYYA